MTLRTTILSAAASAALAACGQGDAPAGEATEDATFADNRAGPTTPATLAGWEAAVMPVTAQQFVDAMASADRFEIEAAQVVLGEVDNASVRSFAGRMVEEHRRSGEELKAAALRVDGTRYLPQLSAGDRARLDALRASGERMERLYIDGQVEAHERTLAVLRAYARTGGAAPLRDFAARQAQVVNEHLVGARSLPR